MDNPNSQFQIIWKSHSYLRCYSAHLIQNLLHSKEFYNFTWFFLFRTKWEAHEKYFQTPLLQRFQEKKLQEVVVSLCGFLLALVEDGPWHFRLRYNWVPFVALALSFLWRIRFGCPGWWGAQRCKRSPIMRSFCWEDVASQTTEKKRTNNWRRSHSHQSAESHRALCPMYAGLRVCRFWHPADFFKKQTNKTKQKLFRPCSAGFLFSQCLRVCVQCGWPLNTSTQNTKNQVNRLSEGQINCNCTKKETFGMCPTTKRTISEIWWDPDVNQPECPLLYADKKELKKVFLRQNTSHVQKGVKTVFSKRQQKSSRTSRDKRTGFWEPNIMMILVHKSTCQVVIDWLLAKSFPQRGEYCCLLTCHWRGCHDKGNSAAVIMHTAASVSGHCTYLSLHSKKINSFELTKFQIKWAD